MRHIGNYRHCHYDNNTDYFFNKDKYIFYRDLFYEIFFTKENFFCAQVFEIEELQVNNINSYQSCIKQIEQQIDDFIKKYTRKKLIFPKPIPEKISNHTEALRSSPNYFLRERYTCSLVDAFDLFSYSRTLSKIIFDTKIYTKDFEYEVTLYEIFRKEKFNDSINESEKRKQLYTIVPIKYYSNIQLYSQNNNLKIFTNTEKDIFSFCLDLSNVKNTTEFNFEEKKFGVSNGNWCITVKKEKGIFLYNIMDPKGENCPFKYIPCIHFFDFKRTDEYLSKIQLNFAHYYLELFKYQFIQFIKFTEYNCFNEEDIADFLIKNTLLKDFFKQFVIEIDSFDPDAKNKNVALDEDILIASINEINRSSIFTDQNLKILRETVLNASCSEKIKTAAEIAYWNLIKHSNNDNSFYAQIAILKLQNITEAKIFDEIIPDKETFFYFVNLLKFKVKDYEKTKKNKSQFINFRIKKSIEFAKNNGFPTLLAK
jgi:hypothetical protein